MGSVLDAFVRFLADTKDVESAMGPGGAVAKAAGSGGEASGKTFGEKFGTKAKAAVAGAGAVGGVLFVGAIESGVKFEDQLRTINTVAELTDGELAAVGDSIQQVSKETGKSTDELTAGFYDLVSAGIDSKDAIGVLKDSAVLATGALGTTGETVDLLTSALNAYGLEATDSGRVSDIFAKAVADGKVTAAQLGQTLSQIAPVASSAGISLEEVSAGFAFLTAKGTPAAAAATQMRAAISALLTPNEQLNAIQQQTGINFAKLAKEKGLAVALEELRKATSASGSELDKLAGISDKDFPAALAKSAKALGLTNSDVEKFSKLAGKDGAAAALAQLATQVGVGDSGFAKSLGSIEAYQFALNTTGSSAADFAQQIQDTTNATGIAQKQYEEKSKSASEQGKRFSAQVNTLIQDLGGPFVGVLGPAVSALGSLGTGMLGIAPIAKLAGGAIGGIVGLAVPALISGLGGLVAVLGPIVTTVFGALGTIASAAIALWPVLLVAAVVAAILFLVNHPEIVAQILAFVDSVITNIIAFLGALPAQLLAFFSSLFGLIVQYVPGFIGRVAVEILKLPFRIAGLYVKMLEFFAHIGTNILGGVAQLIANIVGFFVKLPGRIATLLPQLVSFFGTIATRLLDGVGKLAQGIVDFFIKLPGRLVSVGGNIVNAIINGMTSLPGKLADKIRSAFAHLRIDIGPFHISASGVNIDIPKIDLPHFAVGTGMRGAHEDMVAELMYGEIVVPQRESQMIRQGRAVLGAGGVAQPTGSGGGATHYTNVQNVQVEGLIKGRDKFELANELRRVQDFLTPVDNGVFNREGSAS